MRKSTLGVDPGMKHRKRAMSAGRFADVEAARRSLAMVSFAISESMLKALDQCFHLSVPLLRTRWSHAAIDLDALDAVRVANAAAVQAVLGEHMDRMATLASAHQTTAVKDVEEPIGQRQVEAALGELSARVDDLSCLLNQTADEAAATNRRIEAKLAKTHAGFRESRRDLERLQQAMKAY